MPLISVTEAQRRAWQQEAYTLLGQLLDMGVQHALPVLEWSVTEHALVGTCDRHPSPRAVFDAWATAVQPAVITETTSGGVTQLMAFAQGYGGGRTNVTVVANLDQGAS